MKRTTLPVILKGLEALEPNITRVHNKPRRSLWDGFFASLEAGDSFEVEQLEVNTIRAHAAKHGFELRHRRIDPSSSTVLAQVHNLQYADAAEAPVLSDAADDSPSADPEITVDA